MSRYETMRTAGPTPHIGKAHPLCNSLSGKVSPTCPRLCYCLNDEPRGNCTCIKRLVFMHVAS